MRQLIRLIEDLADAFDRLELQYAFGGALANNYWGIVRTTVDADCLVAIPALKYQALVEELNALGATTRDARAVEASVSVTALREQIQRRAFCRLACRSITVELFTPIIPLQHEILRRAVTLPLEDRDVKITTAEDLILLKMAFHREKDLGDVRGILRVQQTQLDVHYVQRWAKQMLEDAVQRELDTLIAEYGGSDQPGEDT
jgi:hypothetical protein